MKRPYQTIAKLDAVAQAMQLSQTLGLTDQCVFFNDWVAYDERHNYLLEADIGVSLHLDHIETRFAFRTRLLDHLWCGLPTVATRGDVLAELLANHDLARLVSPGDAAGVAQAILELVNTPNLRNKLAANFQQVAPQFQWNTVMQPLIDFARHPTSPPTSKVASSCPTRSHALWWEKLANLTAGRDPGLLAGSSELLALEAPPGITHSLRDLLVHPPVGFDHCFQENCC